MTEPLVLQYLLEHSFEELEEEHGVKAHPGCVDRSTCVFSMNYDQINSKHGDKLAEECRGLIVKGTDLYIDTASKWKKTVPGKLCVLAWPMNRFYNSGESTAAVIDWSSASVQEKLDGTMIILYEGIGGWCVATRKVPNADLPINSSGLVHEDLTFSTLFKEALFNTVNMNFDDWTRLLPQKHTYIFELTSPINKVGVTYEKTSVTLLAARDHHCFYEVSASDVLKWFEKCNVPAPPIPRTFDFSSIESIAAFVDQQDPSKMEGVVVVDKHFNRIKIKNINWVLSSKLRDSLTNSKRSVLEAIFAQRIDDVVPLLDGNVRKEVENLIERVKRYLEKIDKNFVAWRTAAGDNRKEFARLVMSSDNTWKAPYFMLFEKKYEDAVTCFKGLVNKGKISNDVLDTIIELHHKTSNN